MADFLFNDVISSPKGEYFLKTTTDDPQKRITSSFFRNGTLLEMRTREFDPKWSRDTLRVRTREFHDEKKDEVQMLIQLADKLRDSNQAETKNLLGQAFFRRGMYEEAIVEFEEAIILNPRISSIYNNLGSAYIAVKRFDDAITVLEQAISMSAGYADFHNNLGTAYLKKEYCKKAVEQFLRALDSNPYYADAYFNLALAYVLNAFTKEDFALSVNCYQKVIENTEKAAKINPSYLNEHTEQGLGFMREKKYEEAYESLQRVLAKVTKPADTSFILDFYLRVIYGSKKLSSSLIWRHIRQLQELIEKYPNYADLYNHLGVAYVIMSKFVNHKAIQQFDKAMALNPAYERAKRNKRLAEYDHKGMQLLFDAVLK